MAIWVYAYIIHDVLVVVVALVNDLTYAFDHNHRVIICLLAYNITIRYFFKVDFVGQKMP